MSVSRDQAAHELPWWGIVLRGMAMGTADVIPGVSGGTMALILGIYPRLIEAIRSLDSELLRQAYRTLAGRFSEEARSKLFEVIKRKDSFFLVILGAGVVSAFASFAKLIPWLLDNYPSHMNGFFFGMILASVSVPYKKMDTRGPVQGVVFLVATIFAYLFSGLPVQHIDPSLGFIFVCGLIAISAMILPGISGSFLLLILGQYKYILSALRDFNLPVIIVFCAGCGIGILGFSRVLSYFLKTRPSGTMAVLCGLMVGSMGKIWPYKAGGNVVVDGKTVSIGNNVLPFGGSGYEGDVVLPAVLVVLGFVLVMILEKLGDRKDEP